MLTSGSVMTEQNKEQPIKPEARTIIEASWAPQDPRDKLYDENASAGEKVASFTRIIGSFHPILNLFVLGFDIVRRDWRYWPIAGAVLLALFLLYRLWT